MSEFIPKRIILFSDGTGNTMTKNRGSNVWKLYEAIDLSHKENQPKQVVFYDDGVGTERFKPLQMVTGAFGFGLKENILQLYIDLCRTYDCTDDEHDEIFLFGFSRGAYTVRTLAGLVNSCGLIKGAKSMTDAALQKQARLAYSMFRSQFKLASAIRSKLSLNIAKNKCNDFKEKHWGAGNVPIKFLGVWDTVEAVGLPFAELTNLWNQLVYPFKFPDLKLGENVEKACHALAIDDERKSFHPVLWDESSKEDKKRVEQVWFAGMHSNVGGGYTRHGISLVPLNWMMRKAKLRYKTAKVQEYLQSENIHDKMHNSRSGLGLFYRYQPRDIKRFCYINNVTAEIHGSVYERILQSTGSYAPPNVSPDINTIAPPVNKSIWLVRLRIWNHAALVALCGYLFWIYWKVKSGKLDIEHSGELYVPSWVCSISEKACSLIPFVGKSIYDHLLHYYYHNLTASIAVIAGFILIFISNKAVQFIQKRYYNQFWHDYKTKEKSVINNENALT